VLPPAPDLATSHAASPSVSGGHRGQLGASDTINQAPVCLRSSVTHRPRRCQLRGVLGGGR
jgi:hypothetical protein